MPSSAQAPIDGAPRAPAIGPLCQTHIAPFAGVRRIAAVEEAIKRGELRLLAIGSSSTSGVGASSAQATYPGRLRTRLRAALPHVAVTVVNRGIPGETLVGAAARMKSEARKARPDLVLWQLGTNGALRNIEIARLNTVVSETLEWLRERGIGVLLIDPQYVRRFDKIVHYARVVEALQQAALKHKVGLIRRYESMRSLAARYDIDNYLAPDRFHLNDLGYRCLAGYAAAAIWHAAALGREPAPNPE